MMNILDNIDAKLGAAAGRLRKTPRRECLSACVIYTLFFLLLAAVTFIPEIQKNGMLIAGDGNSMYYPHLINFRRSLIDLFSSIKAGSPRIPLINFESCYGMDNYCSCYSFLPAFPLYLISAFLPESAMPAFYTVAQIILQYTAGLTFIYLCRHFKRDMLISGAFAAGYSFCGSYFAWIHGHPQFNYLMIAFPLMVVGLDRVINRTGWKMLTFGVFFTGFCSFTYLIYTLPFLAVFAFFRVLFLKKEKFLPNLLKDFLLCCGAILLGAMLCGIVLMPTLYMLLNSNRSESAQDVNIIHMLIPNVSRLGSVFIRLTKVGVFSFILPCAMIVLMALRESLEKKIYMIVMLILAALPIVSYGVNGFMYDQVRWGFIPALLICYLAVCGIEQLAKLDKTDVCLFAFTAIVFTIIMDMEHEYVASVFAFFMFLIACIPFLNKKAGKLLTFLADKLLAAARWMKANKDGSKRYIVALILIVICVPSILFLIALLIGFQMGWECLIPGLLLGISALLLYKHKQLSRVIAPVLAVVFATSAATQCVKQRSKTNFNSLQSDEIFGYFSDIAADPDMAGRIENLDSAIELHYDPISFEEYEKAVKKGDYLGIEIPTKRNAVLSNNRNSNDCLLYKVPTVKTFNNMMDEDLIAYLSRIGMGASSLTTSVNLNSLGMSDPLYAMFGVDHFFTNNEIRQPYGACDHTQAECEGVIHDIYRNSMSFPVGVTYDTYMSGEDFDGLSGAYLPHAMMESAYLEGFEGETRSDLADRDRQCEVSFELETKPFDKNTMDIEYLENTLTINDDISDKFLYIALDGVEVKTLSMIKYEVPFVLCDDGSYTIFSVTNEYSDWPWKNAMDHYCVPLGYKDHDINEIRFVTPFKYDSIKVYAVPREWFDEAYKERTAETLKNVKRSGSSLEGDITVTGQKLLSVNYLHNSGWSVYVDGEKKELQNVNKLFLGVMLDEGKHHVEFRYFTPWLKEGILLSSAGLAIFIAAGLLIGRKKK